MPGQYLRSKLTSVRLARRALTKSLASAWSHDIAFAALLLHYYKQTLTLTLTPTLTLTLTLTPTLTPTPTLTLTINGAFFLD